MLELVRTILAARFPDARISPLSHPGQRHRTFTMRGTGVHAVAKFYVGMNVDAVTMVSAAEQRARERGIPLPAELYRAPDLPLVVYQHVDGFHRADLASVLITKSASTFVRATDALAGIEPSWAPGRPSGLPRRAREALSSTTDRALFDTIRGCWESLRSLAAVTPPQTCHADWRADNMLYQGHHIVAVLDWEGLARMPGCEGVGYAAAAITHSWRDTLYRPVAPEPLVAFLRAAAREWPTIGCEWHEEQARTACLYGSAVRLAEDRARGVDATSLDTLRAALQP